MRHVGVVVSEDAVRRALAAFVAACADSGVHPSTVRYDRWAMEQGEPSSGVVIDRFGSWNAALTAVGHDDLAASPNRRVSRPLE